MHLKGTNIPLLGPLLGHQKATELQPEAHSKTKSTSAFLEDKSLNAQESFDKFDKKISDKLPADLKILLEAWEHIPEAVKAGWQPLKPCARSLKDFLATDCQSNLSVA